MFIITKDEEERIAKSINSVVSWVNEVIVIDSGSQDRTVEIANILGAKVINNPWPGYVKQKIFGENLCANDWIINIDADEEVSKELRNRIEDLFTLGEPKEKIYRLNIVVVQRNEDFVRKFAPRNTPIRFYHRKYASFSFKDELNLTHDSVNPKDAVTKIVLLKNPVFHRSMISIKQMISKANMVTDMQGLDLYNKGRKPYLLRIIFEPFFYFFKSYILRRHFLFGIHGFIDSVIHSYTRFIRLAKARELFDKHENSNN